MRTLLSVITALLTISLFTQTHAAQKHTGAKHVDAKAPSAAATPKSLFVRLGGAPAITAVVDSFVNTAAGDAKVNFLRNGKYKGLDVSHLKAQLTAFITMATGGPNNYKGRDMKSSHAGMKITSAEFGALAGDLAATLDKFKVPKTEKDELMAIAASTQKDIVEVQ
jgi:hemoglobin